MSTEDHAMHADAIADFEANHKSTAIAVSDIYLAQTTSIIEKPYSWFSDWANVQYIEGANQYTLNLLSATPL